MSEDEKTRLERIAQRDAPDLGYRENELGELQSTISALTEDEIIDRMSAKAVHEIQSIEDRRVFGEIAKAISGFTVVEGGR